MHCVVIRENMSLEGLGTDESGWSENRLYFVVIKKDIRLGCPRNECTLL
jgi:hypothetical protein